VRRLARHGGWGQRRAPQLALDAATGGVQALHTTVGAHELQPRVLEQQEGVAAQRPQRLEAQPRRPRPQRAVLRHQRQQRTAIAAVDAGVGGQRRRIQRHRRPAGHRVARGQHRALDDLCRRAPIAGQHHQHLAGVGGHHQQRAVAAGGAAVQPGAALRRAAQHQRQADVAVQPGQRCGHPFGRHAQRALAAGGQRTAEAHQVGGAGAQAAGAGKGQHQPGRRRAAADVGRRQPRGLVAQVAQGVGQAQRGGDALGHQLRPRLAQAHADQLAQHGKAVVAVQRIAGAGAGQRLVRQRPPQLRAVIGPVGVGPGAAAEVGRHARQAGRVRGQLAQRDGRRVRRLERDLTLQAQGQRVVQRQFAPFHGLRQQHTGEDLADGADLEQRRPGAGELVVRQRLAVAHAGHVQVAVAPHRGHGRARRHTLHGGLQQRLRRAVERQRRQGLPRSRARLHTGRQPQGDTHHEDTHAAHCVRSVGKAGPRPPDHEAIVA
jgi:hypothetical protein